MAHARTREPIERLVRDHVLWFLRLAPDGVAYTETCLRVAMPAAQECGSALIEKAISGLYRDGLIELAGMQVPVTGEPAEAGWRAKGVG